MKVVIVGASGLIGNAVATLLSAQNYSHNSIEKRKHHELSLW